VSSTLITITFEAHLYNNNIFQIMSASWCFQVGLSRWNFFITRTGKEKDYPKQFQEWKNPGT
jgi:hypothetical protein